MLVIEDNLVVKLTTVKMVKKSKLNVIDAEDGKPALALATTQHLDLILADVGLPEMSGIEFIKQLRAFEKKHNKPPVPIIGITAHAIDGREECLNAGMTAVMPKPLTPKVLTEILQTFLPDFNDNTTKKS